MEDADDETARMRAPPAAGEARPYRLQFLIEQQRLEIEKVEASRKERRSATGKEEATATTTKRAKKKSAKIKKRFSESQEHMPSEEQVLAPAMAEMHSDMHGEELPDWMSQLFEKLDLEVNEDNICSTGNVTEVEAHPVAEDVIPSKIQMPTKLKDSSIGFRWRSVDGSGLDGEDAILDWIVDMLERGGHDDLLSQFDLDQEAVHQDVEDELSDLEEDAEDSHTSVKRLSNKETLENGIKWMSEECFLAFTESAERKHFEGIEHRFGELRRQCLNIEAYDKIFHHYNFTIESKHGSSDIWSSKLYFAEVKQLFGLKSYFCCLLEDADDGRCYGCQNMKCDLRHPRRGGYEEGNADICWPFVDDTDSGSDDDCGCSC